MCKFFFFPINEYPFIEKTKLFFKKGGGESWGYKISKIWSSLFFLGKLSLFEKFCY